MRPVTVAISVRTPDAPQPTTTWVVTHNQAAIYDALARLAPALPKDDRDRLSAEISGSRRFAIRGDYGEVLVRKEPFNVGDSVKQTKAMTTAPGVVVGFEPDGWVLVAWDSLTTLAHDPGSLRASRSPASQELLDYARRRPNWTPR
jgi:hypothetical protein